MKSLEEIKKSKILWIEGLGYDGGYGNIHFPWGINNATVIFSWGGGWDHVSVSHPNRCCTWEEMCLVKDIFWEPEDWVVQYHPAKSKYKNIYPYTLHLWKPQNKELPIPPSYMV